MIRPATGEGVLLDERHFNLEDIDALTAALIRKSEGRLSELQAAACTVEMRMRESAEIGRRRIEEALSRARVQLQEQLERGARRAVEVYRRRRQEGYEEGEREGRESGYREGFERGYEEGLEQGLREGRRHGERAVRADLGKRLEEETKHARELIGSLASELQQQVPELLERAHAGLLELALNMARAIVQHDVDVDQTALRASLRRALDRVEGETRLRIELHPRDREAAQGILDELLGQRLDRAVIELVERSELARGGCRLCSPNTVIDATIDGQFEVMTRRLTEAGGVQ